MIPDEYISVSHMKKSTRNRSSSPPVHVHVTESTPVHVHVKTHRSRSDKSPQGRAKVDRGTLRPTASVKTRLPWIPPGKASMRDALFKWEGPTHRLEIIPPLPEPEPEQSQSALRLADLTSEEEEGLHGQISQYERKIDNLMTEVSSLKNEVELRKKEQMLERQSEQLNVSQRMIAVQEGELAEVTKELEDTERENTRLRQSMKKMMEEDDHNRSAQEDTQQDRGLLLRKLKEAEMDGAAAAEQVSDLRDSVLKLSDSGKLSAADSSALARQKKLLLQKLETFETTNRTLRNVLREQQRSETQMICQSQEKELLLKTLADCEAENAFLGLKLEEKEKEVHQLTKSVTAEKEITKMSSDISKTLETTRAHLQGQLRSKEAENNRLAVQIKNLQRAVEQQKTEYSRLKEQLAKQKKQGEANREALKRATRAQKQRAERGEDTVAQLNVQLQDMEEKLSEALSAAETWQSHHSRELDNKCQLELEMSLLKSRIEELMKQMKTSEIKGQKEKKTLLDRLNLLNTENTESRQENQTLQAKASGMEEKLTVCQSELQQVKDSIKQYERLLDGYKIQVVKTRTEADEYAHQLAEAEREAQVLRARKELEVAEVRGELMERLAELESLPDALRRAELQLHEARERERGQERRGLELNTIMTELRLKVDTQGSQIELVKQKNKLLMEENQQLQQQLDILERKLEEVSSQNSDLLVVVSKREEAARSSQLRLDEKTQECLLLSRNLDNALDEARQQMSKTKERAATKERSTQAKIMDLETQLSRTSSEINKQRRCKEEVERRYQSRLQDITDRLEQSDSTNRSLQNYVQFLKASYANVFGDMNLGISLQTPSPI